MLPALTCHCTAISLPSELEGCAVQVVARRRARRFATPKMSKILLLGNILRQDTTLFNKIESLSEEFIEQRAEMSY